MKAIGTEGMNNLDLQLELQRGGRFVLYQYCISILFLTFKLPSEIYFIPAHQSAVRKGWGFSLISLLCGWWPGRMSLLPF